MIRGRLYPSRDATDGISIRPIHQIRMNNTTLTLTESGLLAELLQRQRYITMRAVRRSARLRKLRQLLYHGRSNATSSTH